MEDTLLVSEACSCMLLPLGTYMLSTSCSQSHAYHLMLIGLTPYLFPIIYTLFTICTPCSFLVIYIHIPYVFHTLTTLSPSIYMTIEQSCSIASLCFPITKLSSLRTLNPYSESNLFVNMTVDNHLNCLRS